jgi:hypothetical protein
LIQHLQASLAAINAGTGRQIRQGLLAEAALVGLGALLKQPSQRLGQIADLQVWRSLGNSDTWHCTYIACILHERNGDAVEYTQIEFNISQPIKNPELARGDNAVSANSLSVGVENVRRLFG